MFLYLSEIGIILCFASYMLYACPNYHMILQIHFQLDGIFSLTGLSNSPLKNMLIPYDVIFNPGF